MAGVALVGYIFCIVFMVCVVWLITRRRPRRTKPIARPVQALLDAARRRAVMAVLFSGVVILVLFVIAYFLRDLLGLPYLLAPGLGGAAGMLLYSATPPRVVEIDSTTERKASLVPRTVVSYLPRLGASLVAAAVIAQLVFLTFTGGTSSRDESGRYRTIAFHTADFATVSTPYPGWFYAVPLLLTTVILVAATLLALGRVSSTPALPQHEFADVDAGWRRATNRIILATSGAALLLQFGGVAIQAGTSIHNAYFAGVPVGWNMIGEIFRAGGVLMMIGSIAIVVLAALWALTLPDVALKRRTAELTGRFETTHEEIAP